MVLSKVVLKIIFELRKGCKRIMAHFKLYECSTKARIYNPHENKLDFRTISDFFNHEKYTGYKVYWLTDST